MCSKKAEEVSKMEADLERLRKDRGEGEPVRLIQRAEEKGRKKSSLSTGQPIEIRFGSGEGEESEDSDDVPGGGEDEGQGTRPTSVPVPNITMSCGNFGLKRRCGGGGGIYYMYILVQSCTQYYTCTYVLNTHVFRHVGRRIV